MIEVIDSLIQVTLIGLSGVALEKLSIRYGRLKTANVIKYLAGGGIIFVGIRLLIIFVKRTMEVFIYD